MSRATTRVQTDPRISRRRKAIARSRRRRVAGWVLAVAIAVFVAWAAFASPLLAVRHVQVAGGKHTTATEVSRAAGLSSSDNLLMVSTSAVARAVETLPWVARAQVERMLPGTIKVEIVERRPALVLSLGAARWTVDNTGHVLVAGETSNNLPVLTGMQVDGIKPGQQLASPEARGALAVWRSLPSSVKGNVQAIVAPATDRISLSLADGTVVRYGSSAQLHAKRAVLISLLARLAADHQGVSYIDLSVAADPAVAPLASPAAALGVAPAVTPSPSTSSSPTPQPTPSP